MHVHYRVGNYDFHLRKEVFLLVVVARCDTAVLTNEEEVGSETAEPKDLLSRRGAVKPILIYIV